MSKLHKFTRPRRFGKTLNMSMLKSFFGIGGDQSVFDGLAVSQASIFAPSSRQASSNYGVGYDGRIGMYCEEKDRSWCTSSAANDHRAITIEVASDTTHPYAVNDKAYAALIELVADICKRNGIKKLVCSTDKNTRVNHLNGCNMTVHRDYANKSCPGDYLYQRQSDIAAKVNKDTGGNGKARRNAPWCF